MPLLTQKKPPTHHFRAPSRPFHGDTETRTVDNENARRLWAAVLERAILDLQEHATRAEAVAWISSNRRSVGSFQWICQQLDMDPASVRRALLAPRMAPMVAFITNEGNKNSPVIGAANL